MLKCYLISFLVMLFVGCGDETYYADRKPSPTPTDKTLTIEQKSLLELRCSQCHAGEAFLTDFGAFDSRAKPMIVSGRMPPSGKLPDEEINILVQ